jgi:hypothetical protein
LKREKSRFSFPASRFPFLYYYFIFFFFLLLEAYQGKDRHEDIHPDAANADFFWQQQARGPKISFDGFDGIC